MGALLLRCGAWDLCPCSTTREMAGYSTHVVASFRHCASLWLRWILDESLARLVVGADDDGIGVHPIPSWRHHRGSICHPVEFDLRVKTQTGDPGQAMVASSHVIPFLEALFWRSLAPPCAEDPALLLFDDTAQVLTSKLRCQCPSFSILHDP